MSALRLAKSLEVPLDFATQTAAVLGRRGSGKTHTASVIAEELLGAGIQCVVIDPLDAWSGLRSSADGKREGLPIVVFGGDSGDLPLEAEAGALLADAIVEHGMSAILSLRHLSKSAARRFVADFAEQLYHRKGSTEHRGPLHLFVDEADAFCPQRILPGGERAHGAIDTIVRRGRSSGLGTTLISQRAAVISKDVLTQTEVLVCHQTTGPHDRKALDAWIEANDPDGRRAEFLGSLASLKVGEAWFWSPGWLRAFRRVTVRRRKTFDSSATPKVGERRLKPAKLARVDLDELRDQIGSMIERAAAEDPKALRKRIVELEAELAGRPEAEPEIVEVPAINEEQLARIETVASTMHDEGITFVQLCRDLLSAVQSVRPGAGIQLPKPARKSSTATSSPRKHSAPKVTRFPKPTQGSGEVGTGGLRRMLVALAQRPQGLTHAQIGVRAGMSSRSGTFSTYLGRARSAGWIEGKGTVRITDAGIAALGDFEPLPTGRGLLDYWLHELGSGGVSRLLRVVSDAYPSPIGQDEAAAAAELSPRSGTFSTYLGRLRKLELIEGRGELRASAELFE